MRKFLITAAMLFGFGGSAMAVSLDDITFDDLPPNLRSNYYQAMAAPCNVGESLEGHPESVKGYVTAIAIRWHMLTTIPMSNDDGTWLGIVCATHPNYNVQQMIDAVIQIRTKN